MREPAPFDVAGFRHLIAWVFDCRGSMEAPNLYLAIRCSNLALVLALAAGQAPKFVVPTWKTATPSAPTIKVPA